MNGFFKLLSHFTQQNFIGMISEEGEILRAMEQLFFRETPMHWIHFYV